MRTKNIWRECEEPDRAEIVSEAGVVKAWACIGKKRITLIYDGVSVKAARAEAAHWGLEEGTIVEVEKAHDKD